MAYKTKFLHFKTKASYEAERAKTTEGSENRKIFDAYISFIDEGPTICTWGKEYQCDANSLSVLSQELTAEEQDQVFKNLGWKVHSIDQSDIDGPNPSKEEKTKRIEADALLIRNSGNIYFKGNVTDTNVYFYKINHNSSIHYLGVNITTGKIIFYVSDMIDASAVHYANSQSLSYTQKQQARNNINAADKDELDFIWRTIEPTYINNPTLAVGLENLPLEEGGEFFEFMTKLRYFIEGSVALDEDNIRLQFIVYTSYNTSSTYDEQLYTIVGWTIDEHQFTVVTMDTVETYQMVIEDNILKRLVLINRTQFSQLASNMLPNPNGSAASGISNKLSRADHVHPIQESVSKLTTPRAITITGAVYGSATFDGSSNVSIYSTLNGFDASKITSGTLNADRLPEIPISKIPAAAMERLYVVESQSAAMSLTIQEGDVVQIGSGGPMYFCVSESASTFATKFKVFTAGAATSVPWSGVTGAPTLSLRSLQVNAVGYQVYSNVATSIPMIYAPTEIGTSGQILQSTGNGAPKWINQSAITAGQANQVLNPFVLKINNGSAEDTSVYTFNGSAGKVLNFVSGSNIILTPTQNKLTISAYIPVATSSTYGGIQIGYTTSGKNYAVQLNKGKAYVNVPWTDTNTNYYPTSFTWTNGTTAGPTGSLTGSEMSAVSFGAIPSASATQSGVVTTGDQTFGGIKTIDTINVTNINEATPGEGFWIGYNTEGVIHIGKDGDYDFGTSGGTYSGTANTAKRLLNSLQFSNGQSFNGSSAVTIDLPEIPIALPNPYALTINGTSYTGSSAVSINTARILSTATLSSSTVSAGYSYNNTSSRTISSLSGFSSSNPDSVIISTAKLTFTASNAIKMDGLADLSGTYYIYCLSYMANGKIAVNGAVYA